MELENHELEGDFITLTFDDKKTCPLLPMALSKRVLQLYFKRLRKAGNRIRYFACGEYGEKHRRAHYHAIVIRRREDPPNYQKHWPWGNVYVGTVTSASARYVTGYLTKSNVIPEGKQRWPPFQLQSQGIGLEWAKQNRHDILKELSWVPKYFSSKVNISIPDERIRSRMGTPAEQLKQRRLNALARTATQEK